MPQRSLVSAIAFLGVTSAVMCLGQTSVTFSTKLSPAGANPNWLYSVDFNNDGISDLIANVQNGNNALNVNIAKGDGTFKAPIATSVPTGVGGALAFGDFNGDGNADVVETSGTQIYMYPGQGNGTFGAPKISTPALPSGAVISGTITLSPMPVADFNHDGKIDLIAVVINQNTYSLYLLEGDGTGGFVNPTPIFSAPGGAFIYSMAVGDFDSDSNADVMVQTAIQNGYYPSRRWKSGLMESRNTPSPTVPS